MVLNLRNLRTSAAGDLVTLRVASICSNLNVVLTWLKVTDIKLPVAIFLHLVIPLFTVYVKLTLGTIPVLESLARNLNLVTSLILNLRNLRALSTRDLVTLRMTSICSNLNIVLSWLKVTDIKLPAAVQLTRIISLLSVNVELTELTVPVLQISTI